MSATTLQDKVEAVLTALREAQAAADEIGYVTNGRDDWNVGGLLDRSIASAITTTLRAADTMGRRDYSEV